MGKTELTLRPFLWRARHLFPDREIVSYGSEGVTRYTYAEYARRVAQLSHALEDAGIGEGDVVGTFCWNHHRHFETYFAVPDVGATLHTLNIHLPDEHVGYLAEDAGDRLLFVDPEPTLLAQLERVADAGGLGTVEQFVVMGETVPETELTPIVDYETFIDGYDTTYEGPPLDEDQPAAMCYTSGTTGKPKGVEYTHKMIWTQSMATMSPSGYGFGPEDVVLQMVPMFHINGWGWPYLATVMGTKLVFPGVSPDAADIARLVERESVTLTGGVPTVWLNFRSYLEDHEVDLSSLRRIFNGGGRPPLSLVQQFEEEYDVDVLAGSGMTEVTSLATTAQMKPGAEEWDEETRWQRRRKAGLALPGMEFRVVDDDGEEVPWDGESVGELQYRGPWVTDSYYGRPDATAESVVDGWLLTGDIVTVDEEGYIDIVDRKDDMIKSGGEWISSVDLENSIMDHDQVVEATVVGVPHEQWGERPVAYLVFGPDADEGRVVDELESQLADEYPSWWAPDRFERVDTIPKTSTGKFDKQAVRDELGPDRLGE